MSNTFHNEEYEIIICSKKYKDRAHRDLQNSIKIFLGYYRRNVSKSYFNNSFHSKMYGKEWVQVVNLIFQYDATIRLKYDVQQSCRA